MAIYIKGMDVPKGCEECPFFHRSDYGYKICNFPSKERRIYYGETKRQDFCPLTEVPEPHGRLIDADKAVKDYHEYGISHMYDAVDLADIMADSPTVIEGSE